jgi:hypothetical protein
MEPALYLKFATAVHDRERLDWLPPMSALLQTATACNLKNSHEVATSSHVPYWLDRQFTMTEITIFQTRAEVLNSHLAQLALKQLAQEPNLGFRNARLPRNPIAQ